jgi:hypothetical protein
MKKQVVKSWFDSFTEPFYLFYLGFLASVGLAFGSAFIINILRHLFELALNFEILIYSRIIFSIFYLYFVVYTYRFLGMQKGGPLRNGFILFTILFILGEMYIWITN